MEIEEGHHVVVRERRRVGDVEHGRRPLEHLLEARAGDGVDPRVRGGRHGIVTVGGELLNDFGADEPRASDDDDSGHDALSFVPPAPCAPTPAMTARPRKGPACRSRPRPEMGAG